MNTTAFSTRKKDSNPEKKSTYRKGEHTVFSFLFRHKLPSKFDSLIGFIKKQKGIQNPDGVVLAIGAFYIIQKKKTADYDL